MEGAAAICSAVRCWLRPPFFMSCRHFISCRRELPFSYVDLLAGRGNDRNRVLLTIPLKESTRVRCLGGGALKSMVLQMDFESWTCRHHAFADKKAPGRKLKNAGDAGCRGSKHSLHRKPVCAKTRKQSGALVTRPLNKLLHSTVPYPP